MQGCDASVFEMPALKDDCLVGRGADYAEREAYERGFQTGERAGFEMGSQKATVVLEKMEAAVRDVLALREKLAKDLESQCIAIAVLMAKKIIAKELSASPKEIIAMTRDALTRLERSGQVVIKIHPALNELFTKYRPELLNIHAEIAFDVDPSAPQYGAVVMGPSEEVVIDLDEQLRTLIKDMVEKRGRD